MSVLFEGHRSKQLQSSDVEHNTDHAAVVADVHITLEDGIPTDRAKPLRFEIPTDEHTEAYNESIRTTIVDNNYGDAHFDENVELVTYAMYSAAGSELKTTSANQNIDHASNECWRMITDRKTE